MGNEAKVIRGQLRQIAKELLPEVMAAEVNKAQYARLQAEILSKLKLIEENVRDTLIKLDQRSKDAQAYIIRQVNSAVTPQEPTGTHLSAMKSVDEQSSEESTSNVETKE